ncbi:uncharacterized protein LOC126457541 [Schistocerca serialis cubense]|uniref:uncharacterized protein LOC126457541 n=1 Tax=Schistocerca serialis cubense TaxID=2023355 RepID=UPI00214EA09C|nr:uncharacterized protein LOC126457541 [Schistocerca serialis cubense]
MSSRAAALLLLLLSVALLAAAQAQQLESCLDFCKNVYRPVCAGDPAGGTFTRQFRNSCELRSFNCRNKTRLKIIAEGRCKRDKGTNKNNEQNEQASAIDIGSNR